MSAPKDRRLRRGALVLGGLLAALLGCGREKAARQAAPRRFAIGIYGADDPALLGRLSREGFDSLHAYNSDPKALSRLAGEARRVGMRMVVSPDQVLKGALSEVKTWPIDAWYLQDEPDVAKTPASALREASRRLRDWDPARPQTFAIGEGAPAERYGQIADILMLDWYPVPHLKLDSVADQIDLAYRHLPEGKPLWAVLQAFDWRDFPQRDPKKPRIGRFPHSAEIRFMSYLAIVHGAKGIFYYTLKKPGGRTLLDAPEEFQALAAVARELKALQPILEGGKGVLPPFPSGSGGIEAKAWRYRGRDYAIVLNRDAKAARRLPDALLEKGWRPLFEPRRDPRDLLEKGGDSWSLRPHEVMVFESAQRWR